MIKYLLVLVLLGASPAAAVTVYDVDLTYWMNFALFPETHTGTITTDGTIGAITPENIVGYSLTMSSQRLFSAPFSFSVNSDSGNHLTWTPGSVTASDTSLSFNFEETLFGTSIHHNSMSLGFLGMRGVSNGCLPPCDLNTNYLGQITGTTGSTYVTRPEVFAQGGHIVEVPSPIAGAGLPGLLLAGLLLWRKKPRRGLLITSRRGQEACATG